MIVCMFLMYASSDGRQLSTTSSSAQRKKKTVTTQRQDDDDDDSAGWSLGKRQCQTARTRHADDGNADEDDGSDNISQGIEDTGNTLSVTLIFHCTIRAGYHQLENKHFFWCSMNSLCMNDIWTMTSLFYPE